MFDYDLWSKKHNACVVKLKRLYDLDCSNDAVRKSVKCNSALCVMKNAMLDIKGYFERKAKSSAELCFLVRNIDVIVTGILDINNILFGIGLNKSEKAIERSFIDKDVICQFRTLRSLILAHPVDTFFTNDRGESETIYLEDIVPYGSALDRLIIKGKCDYIKRMCKPESHLSFSEPLSIDGDIIPVINTIIDSLDLIVIKADEKIASIEYGYYNRGLLLVKDTIKDYIISLDKELEKRYPSAVENIEYEDGAVEHYSIIYECLMFYNVHFKKETQYRYEEFLKYIKSELRKIESDLQQMNFDEDKYFLLMYCSNFAPLLSYEKQKMVYLRSSSEKTYTDEYIGNDTSSNALWGIRCFRMLIPYIEKYIPVDTSVSDKELYCQYIAACYFSNVDLDCM